MKALTKILAATIGAASVTVSVFAQQASRERKPQPNFSIAMPKFEGQQKKGPLFDRASEALKSTKFPTYLAPKADLELAAWSDGERKRNLLTKQVVKAVTDGCIGPLSFDEGKDWVQLSWVCPTDESNSLSQFMKFRDSSELTMTIWFVGNKIREIDAWEPLRVPGYRLVSMDAYEQMKARGQ